MMRNWFRNSDFNLDDIVFEGRNKRYGAYAIRRDSENIMAKSMFFGVALFVSAAAIPFVYNQLKTPTSLATPDLSGNHDLHQIDLIDKVILPPPATAPQKQESRKVFNSTVPTPTKTVNKVEQPSAKTSDYDKAVAGLENQEGVEKPSSSHSPIVTPGISDLPVVPTATPPAPAPADDNLYTKVDVEAAYKGGIDLFRNRVMNGFDVSAFSGSGEVLKTTIIFVVEKDGRISSVKAEGPDEAFNREAERTIRKIKGTWTPAKIDGQSVRSYFRFPISMKFE
ncbi:energy transducer TonB [Bergeyella sp. RCAD1439]|uniref:energy transducer TonB n=1 Tax=Bergeyella anatis TaxID=3113737 RepID=UPI002E176788|nr:energy transducer TonB [Bergeyella sp. RCAD1439]